MPDLDEDSGSSSLLELPGEIILLVLSHLPVQDVVSISSTCRKLYSATREEQLWRHFIQEQVPTPISTVPRGRSYRSIYTAHHSHWFLPRYKLWFNDTFPHGSVILARYDERRGCIEGYTLAAVADEVEYENMTWEDTPLQYRPFEPQIRLDLNRTILYLGIDELEEASRKLGRNPNEFLMNTQKSSQSHIGSSFILSVPLPESLLGPGSAVWPPQIIPSPFGQRTRNLSSSLYRSKGHLPTRPSHISHATFRIRQWLEPSSFIPIPFFGGSGRAAEKVFTYATLDPDAYTPTAESPYNGLWVGDFAGNGVEFILISHSNRDSELPTKAAKAVRRWPRSNINFFFNLEDVEDEESDLEQDIATDPSFTVQDEAPFKGRLQAIKLTGDPHVPRGELTFVADDLGAAGLVGFHKHPVFGSNMDDPDDRGVRVVKSVTHIAHAGFVRDSYLPSHLILISHDRMAQYWHTWSHMSFYQRIDIDALLRT